MKSILRQFLNQENVVNIGKFNVDNLILIVNRYPVRALWILWTCYLLVDVISRISSKTDFADFQIILLHYIGGGLFQQFVFFVFLPRLFYLRKWKKITFVLVLLFTSYLLLKLYLLGLSVFQLTDPLSFVSREGMRIFQFQIYITALWWMVEAINRGTEKNRLEIEYDRLQIDHTSIQLNPHLVINLFSGFSASIYPISRELYEDFSNFSSLLSYCYKDPRFPNFLNEEVEAIEHFISSQRSRFGEKLCFNISSQLDIADCARLVIPKGTLMTFVENAFKHGNCFQLDFPSSLTMRLSTLKNGSQRFTFSINNAKETVKLNQSSKFGIEAVKRILTHHFMGHYQLFISETDTEFNLFLYIDYEGNFKDWTA